MSAAQPDPVVHALLRTHRPRGVSPDGLAEVLRAGTTRQLLDDETLCQEGGQAEAIYFLVEGRLRVTRADGQGSQRKLAEVEAPAMVGHMAVIDRSPRSATVRALGPAQVVSLDSSTAQRLLGRRDTAGAALRRLLLTCLSRQLTQGNTRIRLLMRGDPAPASPKTVAPTAPRPGSAGASSEDQLEAIANILEGWETVDDDLDAIEVVYTEDQLRNWPKATPKA